VEHNKGVTLDRRKVERADMVKVVPSTTQGKARTPDDILVHPIDQTVIAVFDPAEREEIMIAPSPE